MVGKRYENVLDIPDKFARFLLDLPGPSDPVGDLHLFV